MGLFPYDCPICGGGEERCGTNHDDDGSESDYVCTGGQSCWEHMVVYKEIGSNCYEQGSYSGYGHLEGRKEIYTIDFKIYFDGWGISILSDIEEVSTYTDPEIVQLPEVTSTV